MPRTSAEAELMEPFAMQTPPPEPPKGLTEGQARFWRRIVTDLPAGHVRSDNEPTLVQLVRHLDYAEHVAEQLAGMRNDDLTSNKDAGRDRRLIFMNLLQMAREQARIIADLSVKLRLVNSSRDNLTTSKRARERTPAGPRPWQIDALEPIEKRGRGRPIKQHPNPIEGGASN